MASLVYPPHRFLYSQQISAALAEDLEHGDITTDAIVPPEAFGSAVIVAKEPAVIAGTFVAQEAFIQMDPDVRFKEIKEEGSEVSIGDAVMGLYGKLAAILQAERVALNFFQRLCGTATLTRNFVNELSGLPCRLVDTRKTTPNFRLMEKWAVHIGGGVNHRFALYDMVMLKDNHVDFAGGIRAAIERTKAYLATNNLNLKIEIETRNLDEVKEVIEVGGVDFVMLDNMDYTTMREAVNLIDGRFETEASGGITEETLEAVAKCGVDFISMGALTHSVKSMDISLKAF
jgi:nicotinate-nucleotide pyrophosphorylase (carboxylating)